MQMIPVRMFFTKTGRAKYTSHLDTMRTVTRCLRRSGLPLWYTEGFNPHLYMTFALPISLGYEGMRESVDLRFTRETDFTQAAQRVQQCMPEGLDVLEFAQPVMDPTEIAWADYQIKMYLPENTPGDKVVQGMAALFGQDSITVTKRTKKGHKELDIRPMVELLACVADGDAANLHVRLAAGNTNNINPSLLLEAFTASSGVECGRTRVKRTNIYNKNLELFL